ncbi:uncharacterized protein DUF4435 [Tumebacillus permanentifrigoris]|uniref:Uncharacterized protein DUF4435 n=1 Tax=Tumebacillus permanentifrigoris TaxID=378543 RepID=A0A316DGB4_9BACL|nr:uncharacterized protein DUF4435 [Tumebacillus permanentifrigoris]
MSGYRQLCLEGTDDDKTLKKMFELKCQTKVSGNKRSVRKDVFQEEACCGLVDRDFDQEEKVEHSRGEGSRCVILRRYALENYLLEPCYHTRTGSL